MKFLASLIGPTASGKTRVALDLSRHFEIEILSADSRQFYRRLDVGTAKPTAEERRACPHHFLDVVDPEETYTAARFAEGARATAEGVRARGRVPWLVGGSGLYLRAAEEGLFEGPDADPELRRRLWGLAEREGRGVLHAKLAEVDPERAKHLAPSDTTRVVRALEVYELTGISLTEHHRRQRASLPDHELVRFGIRWPVPELDERIAQRARAMLARGWVEEVERLLDEGVPPDAPALRALGYPEIRAHLEGRLSRAELETRIVLVTRQFARRQRTWFRRVSDVTWFDVREARELESLGARIAEAVSARSATRHEP